MHVYLCFWLRYGSFCNVDVIFLFHVDGCLSCILFEDELDEACRFIARAKNIISTVLMRYLKFCDGLLTLRDRFLVTDENLRVVEGMKLVSEEMLVSLCRPIDSSSRRCGQGCLARKSEVFCSR